jgi:hypothetical protein
MPTWLKRLLCRLHLHRWRYHAAERGSRTCRWCGRQEVYDADSPSGFAGDTWRAV